MVKRGRGLGAARNGDALEVMTSNPKVCGCQYFREQVTPSAFFVVKEQKVVEQRHAGCRSSLGPKNTRGKCGKAGDEAWRSTRSGLF